MGTTSPVNPAAATPLLSRSRPWLRMVGLVLAAIIIAGSSAFGMRWFLLYADKNAENEDLSVEAQWNRTISRLSIEPVYPPQEDVAVGDVFAVVVNAQVDDRHKDKLSEAKPFIGRAIKLAHILVQDELKRAYSDMPVFPASVDDKPQQPSNPGNGGGGASSENSLFEFQKRTTLPQAAFPGISITFTGSSAAGGKGGGFGFGASASRASEQTVELHLVETYGLPSVVAADLLDKFCNKNEPKDVCSEETARKHLAYVFDNVLEKATSVNTGEEYYSYPVKIIMISRVYYARRIIERSSADMLQGGDTYLQNSASNQALIGPNPTDPAQPLPGQPVTGDKSTDSLKVAALESQIAEVSRHLGTIERGGVATYRFRDSRYIYLDQTFSRPIAFGYRSVTHDFSNLDKDRPL